MLRVFTRTRLINAFGIDDIAILVTLGLFTIYLVCQIAGIAHGTGKHRWELTDDNAQIALRYWFFCEIFQALATSACKVAIGLFLLRITINPLHVWILRILMICCAVLGSAYALIILFQCDPVSYWWDLDTSHKGTCISANAVAYTTYVVSALNSAADWVFGILPVLIVKNLQMQTRTKVLVSSILGLAAIGCTATIVRMPYLWTVKEYKGDFLWRTADVAIWTTVEIGIGITAACMATLKPLLRHMMQLAGVSTSSQAGGKSTRLRSTLGRVDFMGEGAQPLSELKLREDKSTTTTTIKGMNRSSAAYNKGWPRSGGGRRSDSEEEIMPSLPGGGRAKRDQPDGWEGGISINTSVEVTASDGGPGSRAAESSQMAEESLGKPTWAYERV
ncbi:hypothetical protein MBLNU459_g6049t1 [Dothideomycetes sp. NU459]